MLGIVLIVAEQRGYMAGYRVATHDETVRPVLVDSSDIVAATTPNRFRRVGTILSVGDCTIGLTEGVPPSG